MSECINKRAPKKLKSTQLPALIMVVTDRRTIGGGSYWAGRAAARPLFGLSGPQLCLARPLLAT